MRHENQADSLEPYVQSFVVRVWLEQVAEEPGPPAWRGQITHVPSGEQCYVTTLDEIPSFMASYLERWGRQQPSMDD